MGYLAAHEEQNIGRRRNDVSAQLGHIAAWRLFSALMRRHPAEFEIVEETLGSDDYSKWSLIRAGASLHSGREERLITVHPIMSVRLYTHDKTHKLKDTGDGLRSEVPCPMTEGEFRWPNANLSVLELCLTDELDWLVRDIEGCLGLEPPELTPITDHSTIGPRFIFEAMNEPNPVFGTLMARACLPNQHIPRFLTCIFFEPLHAIRDLRDYMITEEIGAFPDEEFEAAKHIFFLHEVVEDSEFEVAVKPRPLFAVDVKKGILYLNTVRMKSDKEIGHLFSDSINLIDAYQEHGRAMKPLLNWMLGYMEPPEEDLEEEESDV